MPLSLSQQAQGVRGPDRCQGMKHLTHEVVVFTLAQYLAERRYCAHAADSAQDLYSQQAVFMNGMLQRHQELRFVRRRVVVS